MTVKELLVKISADTSGFDKGIDLAVSKTRSLKQEKKELQALIKEEQGTVKRLTAAYDDACKTYGKTSNEAKKAAKALDNVKSRESELAAQVSETNSRLKEQQSRMNNTSSQAANVQGSILKLGSLLKGLITGDAGKKIFDVTIIDNAKMEQEMTSFEVLLQGNVERAKELMSELTEFAAKTPLTLPDTTKATKLLLGYGVQADNVITVLQRLGDLSQGDAEKLDRVSLAYGQMLAKGKVTGEELRQMAEAQVPMTQALADALGVTTAQLSAMIEKGQVGIPVLNKTIENMTSEGGQFYNMMEKQSQTAAGLFSTLKDNLQIEARDIGTGAFEYLKGKLSDLLAYIKKISDNGTLQQWGQKLGSMLEKIFKVITGVVQKLFELRSVVVMVIGAFAGLKVAMGVFAAMQMARGIIQAFSTATTAATAAQTGLNAAMWANPAGIIVGVIAGVVGAIAAAVIAYRDAKKSVEEYGQAIDELNSREQTVIEKFQEYQLLMSKSNAFGLNAAEKEKLVSVSKELVDTYGLEYNGIDNLTGAYKISTEAMDKYAEAARRQRNELLRGQTEERNKRIESNLKDAQDYMPPAKVKEFITQAQVARQMMEQAKDEMRNTTMNEANYIAGVIGEAEKYGFSAILTRYLEGGDLQDLQSKVAQQNQKYTEYMHDVTQDFMDNIKAEVGDTLTEGGENLLTDILTSYMGNADNVDKDMLTVLQAKTKSFAIKYGKTINTLTQNLQTDQDAVDSGGNMKAYQRLYDDMQKKAGLIQKMSDEGVISADEAKRQINGIMSSITSDVGLAMTDIMQKFGENVPRGLESTANSLISLDSQFKNGSITIGEYLKKANALIDNADFKSYFAGNESAAEEFFAVMSNKYSNVFSMLNTQFESGEITLAEYTRQVSGVVGGLKGMAEQAESIGVDGQELDAVNSALDNTSANIESASENLKQLENVNQLITDNFDMLNGVMDTSASQYKEFVQSFASEFGNLSEETQGIIKQTLADTAGYSFTTAEQMSQDMLKDASLTSAAVDGVAAATGNNLTNLVNAGGNLLIALGNAIKEFHYNLDFVPQIDGYEEIKGFSEDSLLGGVANKIISFQIPKVKYSISGSGEGNSLILGNAIADLGRAMSTTKVNMSLSSYAPKKSRGNSDSMGSYASSASSGSSGKGKSGSGGDDRAAQEAEKARKAQTDAYKNYIEENERLDERWNKREQEYGRLNDEQWLYNLAQRAERYRWYADDVLNQDYMTFEEQQELRQKYLEKAEDIDLEYYKYYKQMVEKAAKDEKKAYSERLEGSKDWIAREKALGRMSADEEIAAGRRVQEYTLEAIRKAEENREYSAEQKKDLIKDMWKTYIEYADREIELERDKLDKIYEMNKENQEKTTELIEKTHSDRERWVSMMTGRDDMTAGEQIAAITKWLEGEEAEKAKIWDSYEEVIAQIRQRRRDALDSGEYDENDDYIKELDKQIAEEETSREEAWTAAHQYYEDLQTQRYQLYRDFLNQEVEDFISAEREKVEAKYKAMEEMEAAENRDKKRAELEEQIKQYEGAVTKEGKEKLKSLKDELDVLNKEEAKAKREQEKEQELDNLDELEKGMKEQIKVTARLSIDSDEVASQLSEIIENSDKLSKQWSESFTKPWSDYFGNILPKQIENAFHMPDYSYSLNADNLGGGAPVVTTIDRSRHVQQTFNVKAANMPDMISLSSMKGFLQ